jgi:hypothetical protein
MGILGREKNPTLFTKNLFLPELFLQKQKQFGRSLFGGWKKVLAIDRELQKQVPHLKTHLITIFNRIKLSVLIRNCPFL